MQVILTWNSVPGAVFYNIYRGTLTGGPYNLIAQSNPNPGMSTASGGIVTTFTDGPGNLVNGQTYYYRISAVTVDGESAYSTPQTTATAPAQPSAPSGVAAVVT